MTARDILNRAVLRAVNVDIRLWDAGHSLPREVDGQERELSGWIDQYTPEKKYDLEEEEFLAQFILDEEAVSTCRTIQEACELIERTL